MTYISEDDLTDAIAEATRQVVNDLRNRYPHHHFYYFSLTTSGEASVPAFSAWSHEALKEMESEIGPEALDEVRWSYSDSPFCRFGMEHHWGRVEQAFARRPEMGTLLDSESAWEEEYELRLRSMTSAMKRLDAEGIFGTAQDRQNVLINVEVMSPDYSNTVRARALNRSDSPAFARWLAEAAED